MLLNLIDSLNISFVFVPKNQGVSPIKFLPKLALPFI